MVQLFKPRECANKRKIMLKATLSFSKWSREAMREQDVSATPTAVCGMSFGYFHPVTAGSWDR